MLGALARVAAEGRVPIWSGCLDYQIHEPLQAWPIRTVKWEHPTSSSTQVLG